MARDARDRFASAHDALLALDWIAAAPQPVEALPSRTITAVSAAAAATETGGVSRGCGWLA